MQNSDIPHDDRPPIPSSVNLSHCSVELRPAPGLLWVMEVRSRGWQGQAPITQHPLITVTGQNPCRMVVLAYRALGFSKHRAQELAFFDLECFSGFPEHPEVTDALSAPPVPRWVEAACATLIICVIAAIFLAVIFSLPIFQN